MVFIQTAGGEYVNARHITAIWEGATDVCCIAVEGEDGYKVVAGKWQARYLADALGGVVN